MSDPPVAKKEPHFLEIHGQKIRDDYFWLRMKDTEDVISYLEAENKYTSEKTAHTKELQEKLFIEMKGRIKETDESVPMKIDDYYYYYRTEEGKNYSIHCRKFKSLDAPEEIILDENLLAEGKKYMKVGSLKLSPDQKMIAYSVDFTGGETYDTRIADLGTGEVLDTITKIGRQIEWDSDCKSIFYSELDDIHRDYAVSRHLIGTNQSDDERLIEEEDTTFSVTIFKSNDKNFLFTIISSSSSETNEIRYIDLRKENRSFDTFFSRIEGIEFRIEHHGGFFYFLTNIDNAINFKMMRTNVTALGNDKWEELVAHDIDVRLSRILAFQDYIVIGKREGGYANIMIYDLSNGKSHDVALPESIYGLEAVSNPVFESDVLRFVFSSPVTPKSVYDYNMASRSLELKKVDEIKKYDPSGFVTERRYATAEDGAKIPISIAHKKGIKLDGTNPLLLYGYGSYGYPIDPHFDSKRLSLIERGLVFAIAHIRGGGEYGKPWYHQGKLANKMNTFTDFIACGEYLISKKFTSKEKLSIMGGSAGGLLMGAVVNLRPDLFGSAVVAVPFVDVISTMLDESIPLTTFEFKEWGNPKVKEEFDWMIEYSPYDNVEAKDYPPILITSGFNDPRVQYWEPAKWIAKLRALKTDSNPLLLEMKMDTGHGGQSGRYDAMKDWAFRYAFILDTLKIDG
ncbi:MAG: S9 family peptidase [Candidatus Thorarchaeota archaeon]|jgi:oligopeptidase B